MPTILIVDDRPANREYLCTLLGSCGYHLLEAGDGVEALEKVHKGRPDLVIADILMPTMDGYEFCRQLRRDPKIATTPVVFLTAHYADEVSKGLAESCGVYHVMTKPVEPEVILTTVSTALGLPLPTAAAKATSASFEREHTRLLTDTLARKANDLESSNRQLASLIELGQQLASEHDPKRLLSDFCQAAGRIVGADYTVVAVRNEEHGPLRHVLACGVDPATIGRISSPAVVEKLLAFRIEQGQSLLFDNIKAHPRVDEIPSEFVRLDSLSLAPIASSTKQYGMLCLGGVVGMERLNSTQKKLAASMGAVIAVTYENAIRYEQIQLHAMRLEREVAERKRAEEQVQRLNVELEQRVVERTKELDESHHLLRQSERMAAIGTLSAGLGHDMGNLLFPIRIRLDAMQQQITPSPEINGHIEAIRKCMGYLQTLTNGLRLLAVDPEDAEASSKVTELGKWQADLQPLLKSMVPRGIALECRIAEDLPSVRIAPHRLTQAIFNLVNNSCDALRQAGIGKGEITVSAEVLPDGASARLTVQDNGPGMSEDVRRRALEPFFTTKKRALSTGLGLSLVHGIVDSAGGTLNIDSELGRGTTITVTLPLTVNNPRLVQSDSNALKPIAALSLGNDRLRALVSSILESLGYAVHASESPHLPDAVLWLTDSHNGALDAARSFLATATAEDRRVGVFGELSDQHQEWKNLGAMHINESARLSELRDALRQLTELPLAQVK